MTNMELDRETLELDELDGVTGGFDFGDFLDVAVNTYQTFRYGLPWNYFIGELAKQERYYREHPEDRPAPRDPYDR